MKSPNTNPLKFTGSFQLCQQESEKILSEEELNRIQARFLADVSHELRTPLSVIKLYIEAIQDGMYENNDEAFTRLGVKFKEFEDLIEQLIKQVKS